MGAPAYGLKSVCESDGNEARGIPGSCKPVVCVTDVRKAWQMDALCFQCRMRALAVAAKALGA